MASMPRRDRGERDDARSGGNYRVALSGSFWPIVAVHEQFHQLGFSGALTEKGNSIAQQV